MKLAEVISLATGRANIELIETCDKIPEWKGFYEGYVKSFHDYTVYNGKAELKFRRFSLCMPKKACEDWANLLINEKTDITLGDEASQKVLEQIFADSHFWLKANEGVEKTFALGMGAWIVSVEGMAASEDGVVDITGDEKVNISFINATKIRPITIEDDKVTECAFIKVGTKQTNVSVHLKDEQGFYKIYNFVCEGTDENSLQLDDSKMWIFNTKASLPWFTILKPNVANNVNIDSPLGVSIFANAIDIVKGIDIAYDSLCNEVMLGKMRIYVNVRNRSIDAVTGAETPVFDSNDVVHYILPEADDGSQAINAITPQLRVGEHEAGLQQLLNLFSYAVGFGTEHYKFNAGGVATATQIVSENSEMFRNIRRQEILIEDALIELVKTIIYASTTFTNNKMQAGTDIEVKFDDSIIEDKQAEKASDRLDVAMNVMSKAEFRAKWYNEDLETAQRKIDEIDSITIDDNEAYLQDIGEDNAAQNEEEVNSEQA